MRIVEVKDELLHRVSDTDPEEFEHLCKILVEQTEQTTDIELTPFHGDGGIDIRGHIGKEFYQAQFGVQVKHYSKRVGSPAMRGFVGALRSHNYQFGSFITSSEFNSGAIEVAKGEASNPITLIDGNELAEIMTTQKLGVDQTNDQLDIDEEFWDLFGTSTEEDLVKSDAVPQADSFSVLNVVLRGLDNGHRYKHKIRENMIEQTGKDWTPRQADYYPQAGWALGYVHKDPDGEYDGRSMRQWGLTRDGQEYLAHLRDGNEEAAKRSLITHIRGADIIDCVLDRLKTQGTLTHDELGQLIEEESELNETTANRRRGTVGNWLDFLPEVRQSQHGQSLKYEYIEKDLGDF